MVLELPAADVPPGTIDRLDPLRRGADVLRMDDGDDAMLASDRDDGPIAIGMRDWKTSYLPSSLSPEDNASASVEAVRGDIDKILGP